MSPLNGNYMAALGKHVTSMRPSMLSPKIGGGERGVPGIFGAF